MARKKGRKKSFNKVSRIERPAYWKLELQKARDPFSVLSQIKAHLPTSMFEEILTWIQTNPPLHQKLFGCSSPRQNNEWVSAPLAENASWAREILWGYYRLRPHISKINKFIALAKEYEIFFLRGDYEKCLELLDSIHDEFGLSLWLSKRRIHLLQIATGLEAQKEYANSLINETGFTYIIIPYLIHYVSYRAESSVSPQSFEENYRESLLVSDVPETLSSYLQYHILSQNIERENAWASILNYESTGSLLDYYEALVATSQMAAASSDNPVKSNISKALYELGNTTEDDRLLRVVTQLGHKIDSDSYSNLFHDSSSYEAFVSGNEALTQVLAEKSFENTDTFVPENLLLLALAGLNTDSSNEQEAPWARYPITKSLRAIFSGEGASKSERDTLYRFAWSLDGSAISHLLRCAIRSEENPVFGTDYDTSFKYSVLCMGKYHPIQSWWSTSCHGMAESLYPRNERIEPGEINCQNACPRCLEHNFEHLDREYKLWECARQLIRDRNYSKSLEYVHLLAESTNPFYRKQSVLFTIYCLLELDEIEECMEAVTDFLLNHPHSSVPLPLTRLMAAVTPEKREHLTQNISFPLLCHFYTLATGGREPHWRSDSVEDFLTTHNLSRPSQLREHYSKFPQEKLLLFLYDICLEQVMDTWVEFSSSEDVALERVEVCKLLSDLCPENNDIYQSEIRDIIRRLTIRKRITEVEKSKIYVDTESVREVAKRTLREDYDRYIAFRSSSISEEYQKALQSALEGLMSGNAAEFLSLNFPKNEMSALLEKMVVHLRDEFVASSQHGLDGYLSVRIRHGTLEGQLRSAFEAETLLSQKCSETNEYKPNQFWLEHLSCEDGSDADAVTQAFQNFSSGFDQLVHDLKKDWIQIKKKTADPGRIDFTLRSPEVDYIASRITEETTIDEFIEFVMDYFISEKLNLSLKNMRKDIEDEIKPKLNDLLTNLQTSIERDVLTGGIYELRSAIGRARTSGQNTLARISGWFRLAKTETKEPFLLDDVISISESSVQASCPEFSVVRKIDASLNDFLLLARLPSFVDLLCLIFDNIVRRSGLTDFPQGIVSATYIAPYLRIRVENEVASSAATESKRRRVEEIKEAVKSQLFSKSVSKEGGTGFIKVQKILNHDFKPPHGKLNPELDFGFSDESKFFVDVGIPIHSERKIEEEK
jgi:hypothetical protein